MYTAAWKVSVWGGGGGRGSRHRDCLRLYQWLQRLPAAVLVVRLPEAVSVVTETARGCISGYRDCPRLY